MPKSLQHNNTLMQLLSEVNELEMTLIEHIRSKQDMTSTVPKAAKISNIQLQQTPIAIVGMASIFPQSRTLQEYWQKIIGKVNCITDIPANRWNTDDYYDPDPTAPDKTYCKKGGFIPEIDFNPLEFGIPPNQLEVTDISQLLALVVAKEALKDAGYGNLKPFDREHTGVVLGVALARQLTMPLAARLQYPIWEKALKSSGIANADIEIIINKIKNSYIDWSPNAFPGMLANVVAGRIANRFDLGGMNCIVDAACASSFGALSMAISELTSGRANMMLTGGVDTDNSIMAYMCFSKTPAVSRGEKPKPFDIDSDGMMLGEGVGMLVLKRLADAERDKDRIYAVIKGIGTSSDGRHKSIYAPRPEGQMRALGRAYQEAGFEPTTVGMIEAHGTGTMAGDPAEFAALKAVFGEQNDVKQQIALGSVKSQIGHTKAAAGAASLIKTALALHHKILPPTINVTKPHPKLEIEDSPFYLNTAARPWIKSATVARRAGVSSFGFGGTNYHIVLEEHHSENQSVHRLHNTPQAILIDAPTANKLLDRCKEILHQLQSETPEGYFTELVNESKTKEIGVDDARLGFVAISVKETRNKLQKAIALLNSTNTSQPQSSQWNHPSGIFYRQTGMSTAGKIVALFSGQSSQYLEMGKELVMNFPCLRETYHQVDRLMEQDGLEAISKVVFPPPVFEETAKKQQGEALQKTEIAQPAIAAFSTGLYKLLQRAGFKPDFVAGHSFGELTALWAAGVLRDQDYFFLVKERGQAMATSESAGAMLAVQGDVNQIRAAIAKFEQIAIANWNSPQQMVLAGDKAEIVRAQAELEQQGYSAVILPVSAAFHTPQVAHAQAPFAKAVEAITFNQPQVSVFTNVSGDPYPNNPQDCQKILQKHLLSQVLFQKEIENIYAAGGTCFVEFGPRSILTHLVKEILGDRPHLAVALNPSRQKDSDLSLREAVVQLRVAGLSLPNLDPDQVVQSKQESDHPLNVSLTSVNYVSEKTKKSFAQALKPQPISDQHNLTVANTVDETVSHRDATTKSQQNGHSKKLATMNEVSMTPDQSPQPGATDVALERILNSLECSLGKFHQHHQETLAVHQQYLRYQLQYVETCFQLMQQQHQLWTNVQNSPREVEVKTAVIASAERSLLEFQKHQSNTLRVHEQYLNHQAQYAQNFFLLTQQSYPQLLLGDSKLNASHTAIALDYQLDEPVVLGESMSATPEPLLSKLSNGNGHYEVANLLKTATVNGNGHSTQSESVGTSVLSNAVQLNGDHHAELVADQAVPPSPDTNLDTAIAVSPVVPEIDFTALSETLVNVVSEKTGYPPEMLELDMDMEADLGIDSIKRVEILGALQEKVPNLPQPNLEDLGDLRTLNQIIEYLRSFDSQTTTVESVAKETQPESIAEIFLKIVSEKTGYPVPSLNLEMNLQADLGIDAVKRREIFDTLKMQMSLVSLPTSVEQSETLTQVIDYLKSNQAQKKTPISAMAI
jgi:polyketide-type polyunsaturated fatty acid synthase PfaA